MLGHKYIVLGDSKEHHLNLTYSNPYFHRRVRDWDQKLHRTLSDTFSERRLTNKQIKHFLRTNKQDKNLILKHILMKQEPALGKLLLERKKLSLLWIAVLSGYQNTAELIVRSGADVNELYGLKSTCEKPEKKSTDSQVRSGVRLNSSFKKPDEKSTGSQVCSDTDLHKLTKKSTVLHALVQMYPSEWNDRFIGLLIKRGANLKARDSDGCTAIHLALIYSRFNAAEILLEGGAEINSRKFNREKVLRSLAMSPDGEHVNLARNLMKEYVSSGELDRQLSQLMREAIKRKKHKLVNLFLDKGANVNACTGSKDEFPLYIAARECQDPEMLRTLLKRGANIDLRNRYGETALHGAIFGEQFIEWQKTKILLSVGADMFAQANDYSTPFEMIYRKWSRENANEWIKTLAMRKACLEQPSVEFRVEMMFKERFLWSYYESCIKELSSMKTMTLINNSCTFFDLLSKCPCQMIGSVQHCQFESQFKLYDLRDIPIFAGDLIEAFQRAKSYYQSMLDQENLIDESVYSILPNLVLRKVARYIFVNKCEVCELKKIVQASRSML